MISLAPTRSRRSSCSSRLSWPSASSSRAWRPSCSAGGSSATPRPSPPKRLSS
ncbi:hypothetical protein ACFPRL_23680 [Pseudoclavibacter helvolus]